MANNDWTLNVLFCLIFFVSLIVIIIIFAQLNRVFRKLCFKYQIIDNKYQSYHLYDSKSKPKPLKCDLEAGKYYIDDYHSEKGTIFL